MNRLTFLAAVALVLVAPVAVEAQAPGKIPRIGVVSGGPAESPFVAGFFEALRELGYATGRNVIIEWRSSGGNADRFPDLAAELARLKVDVIVAGDNPAIAAAQRATKTIPIVMVLSADPVGSGFVASLARPGGNITGLTSQTNEVLSKRPQLLKEAVPTVERVAVLWDPTESGRRAQVSLLEAAARGLGLRPRLLQAHSAAELDTAFGTMISERVDALIVMPSQMSFAHRTRIAEFAARRRLPAIGPSRWYPGAGGLMYYGTNNAERWRRAPYFVDKILKGANPAELPDEQPTKFELVINMKAARALGLTLPPSLLLRADRVIE